MFLCVRIKIFWICFDCLTSFLFCSWSTFFVGKCVPQTVHLIFALKTKRKLKIIPIFDFSIQNEKGNSTRFSFSIKNVKNGFQSGNFRKILESFRLGWAVLYQRREPTHSSSLSWHSIFVWFFDFIVKKENRLFSKFSFLKKMKKRISKNEKSNCNLI